MLVALEEKFRQLDCEKKIQKLVVCMEVFMKVSIHQEKVIHMVQAVEALLCDNGTR